MVYVKYIDYVETYINMATDDDKILEAIKVLALIEIANNIPF